MSEHRPVRHRDIARRTALLELHADGKLVLMNAQVDAEPCEDATLGL